MRTLFSVLGALALVAVIASPAFSQQSVQGRLVDQGCYLKDKANNADNDHKMPADTAGCAIACAKKGLPLALVAEDGKVYSIAGDLTAENNAKLVPHMGHIVAITGAVATKGDTATVTGTALKMISQ